MSAIKRFKKIIPTIIYLCLFYVLLFQNVFQFKLPHGNYIDEIVVIATSLIALLVLITKGKERLNEYLTIAFFFLFGVVIIGIAGNIIYHYQSAKSVLIDAFTCSKFLLMVCSVNIIKPLKSLHGKTILINAKILTIAALIGTIFNYFVGFGLTDPRFGLYSNKLCFTHPTILAALCVFVMGNILIFRKKKRDLLYIVLLSIVLFTTLRTKAIVFAILAMVYILINKYVLNKKTDRTKKKPVKIILICSVCIIVSIVASIPAIHKYFFKYSSSARNRLIATSFTVAEEHFPIGSGFATYGSFMSGDNYSPIYEKYGLSNVTGISREDTSYLNDNFWPMILGQFGYIGLAFYIMMVLMVYLYIREEQDNNAKTGKLLLLVYLLIASTSESAFVHYISVPLALMIGV